MSLPGPALDDRSAAALDRGLAGVVLFSRNIESLDSLSELCAEIRRRRPEAIIALDEEGGEVTRIEAAGGSSWPGARALGVIDRPEVTRDVAASIAGRLAAAGVTLNLAPVADVATNEDNPVIGNRSFGSSPDLVSRHVRAWIEGTRSRGLASCVKHFPGHGDTSLDSHLSLPSVTLDVEDLRAVHVAPFRTAIDAGVEAVMTAHVVYPALDRSPATLSPVILSGLLKGQLGFTGTVITDAIDMKAISAGDGMAEGAVRALAAGADLVCMNSSPDRQEAVVDAVRAAMADGRLAPGRVVDAARRSTALARRPQAGPGGPVEMERRGLALAVEAVRAGMDGIPARPADAPLVVELLGTSTGIGETKARLTPRLKRLLPGTEGRVLPTDDPGDPATVLQAAGGRPLVVVGRNLRLGERTAPFVRALAATRPDLTLVALGSPADRSLGATTVIPAWGSAPPNMTAVAQLLAGEEQA